MDDSNQDRIARLLREGLDHYGIDDVSSAMLAWEQVLKLEPDHPEASDYVKSADRRTKPRSMQMKAGANPTDDVVLDDARSLMHEGAISEAYELLSSVPRVGAPNLELEAGFELARSRLYGEIRLRMGGLSRVPSVCASPESMKQFNLPADAGFLLSMVDGMTPLSDLISVSGMDAFDALHTVEGLIQSGLVELGE